MTNEAASQIQIGMQRLAANDPAGALAAFEAAEASRVGFLDATSLAGVALSQLGRKDEAEARLNRAISDAPQALAYRVNRIDHWIRWRALERAIADCESLIAEDPKSFLGFDRLGDIRASQGDDHAAADSYRRALELNPGAYETVVKFAHALFDIGDLPMAGRALQHARNLNPSDPELLLLMGKAAFAQSDWKSAAAFYEEHLSRSPERAEVLRMLANAKSKMGDYEEAAAFMDRALQIGPRTASGLVFLANVLMFALSFEQAEVALEEARALEPASAAVAASLALLRIYQGRQSEAEGLCLDALKADPDEFSVYPRLSSLRHGRLPDEAVAGVERFKANPALEIGQRATASFLLAHHFDALGDYAQAFDEYVQANRIARARNTQEGHAYNPDGADRWTSELIELFAKPNVVSSSAGARLRPIFIVGLPRCGSTLVESLIGAHSQTAAGGEMPMMPRIFSGWIKPRLQSGDASTDPAQLDKLRKQYEAGLRELGPRIVDKNLLNIDAVGLILQLYPDARIVYMRRRPLDAALAVFRQDLPKFWSFATSLEWISRRYVQVARLTRRWEHLWPDNFTTVQYEDFAANLEPSAKTLLDFCDLEWEQACLDFQNTDRIAATISAVQVREPVAPRTSRSEAYADKLGGARRVLEEAGVDLATGALIA